MKNTDPFRRESSFVGSVTPKRPHKMPARASESFDGGEATEGDESRSPFQEFENKEERAFKKGFSRLLSSTHAYVEAGHAFAKARAALGADLQELSSMDWIVQQQISQHVSHVGNLMRSLSAIQDKTVSQVQDACDMPIFQLLDLELQELRSASENRSRAEEAVSRQRKKSERFAGEPAVMDKAAVMDKTADQARAELETQMASLDDAKQIKLFRFLRALVASEEGFYKMGNHGMAELAPHTNKLQDRLAALESSYGKRCRDAYVWKLSHKMGKWKRVWLVLRNGSLEVRSEGIKKEARVGRKMNLLISTVRVPVVPRGGTGDDFDGEKKFEFEIVTPERKRGWMFATKSEADRQEWIDALQASIGSLINNQQLQEGGGGGDAPEARKKNTTTTIGMSIIRKVIPGGKGHRKSRSSTSAEAARMMAMSLMQEGSESSVLAELSQIPGNDVCVDCGKSEPDWASMNIGVLFCLNCSGVHRHLGSHISKVRSLTMDKWPEGTLRYMKSIGNKKANEFWEARLDPSVVTRLRPNSTQQERTEFITAKYEKRKFCEECPVSGRSQINDALFKAVTDIEFAPPLPLKSGSSDSPFGTPTLTRRETADGVVESGVGRSSSSSAISPRKDLLSKAVGADAGRPRSGSYSGGILHSTLLMEPEKVGDAIWPMYKWLAWGADINAQQHGTNRSLGQVLLEKRDPWLMHLFLVHGVEVAQIEEETGDSLLHFAARHNLFECLDVLFTHLGSLGPSAIHTKNLAGQTPLDLARASGSVRVLELFTARDIKPLKESGLDESPRSAVSSSMDSSLTAQTEEVKRSPRHMSNDPMDERGESGMQKFLKKATGGHLRSKSVFQPPSAGAGGLNSSGPIREVNPAKLGTLSKILRKDKRTPTLSSKGSAISSSPQDATLDHDDDESFSVSTPGTTPLRQTFNNSEPSMRMSASSSMGEEVVVRAGKNPLMKGGKGLDQRAIQQAMADAEKKEAVAKGEERDLMGFISTEESGDE